MKTLKNTYYGLRYGDLTGKVFKDDINTSYHELDSLEGAPKIVRSYFDCSHNRLKSLKYSPKEVYGTFDCSYNEKLESLKGAPELVKGNFDCTYCPKLTSLDKLLDTRIGGKLASDIMTDKEFRELQALYRKANKNMKKYELLKKLKDIK